MQTLRRRVEAFEVLLTRVEIEPARHQIAAVLVQMIVFEQYGRVEGTRVRGSARQLDPIAQVVQV